MDLSNPEDMMRLSKKGKTVMMFVRVKDSKGRDETEEVTSIWQTGLWNNHIQAERFVLEDDRVMFMFKARSFYFMFWYVPNQYNFLISNSCLRMVLSPGRPKTF